MSLKFSAVILIYYLTTVEAKNWQQVLVYLEQIAPSHAHLLANDSITIYCGSTSWVSWSYTWYETRTRAPVFQKHKIGYRSITLINSQEQHSGLYNCHSGDNPYPFSKNFLLSVWDKVPFGAVLPSWKEVSQGDSITLTCGSITPVQWFSVHFNSQNKSVWGTSVTIHNLKGNHSGPYVCRGVTSTEISNQYRRKMFHNTAIIVVDREIQRIYRMGTRVFNSH